jgi:hypothetical protein
VTARVIQFPITDAKQDDRLVWVCNCNCMNFRIYGDGVIECAACETRMSIRAFDPDEPLPGAG